MEMSEKEKFEVSNLAIEKDVIWIANIAFYLSSLNRE